MSGGRWRWCASASVRARVCVRLCASMSLSVCVRARGTVNTRVDGGCCGHCGLDIRGDGYCAVVKMKCSPLCLWTRMGIRGVSAAHFGGVSVGIRGYPRVSAVAVAKSQKTSGRHNL